MGGAPRFQIYSEPWLRSYKQGTKSNSLYIVSLLLSAFSSGVTLKITTRAITDPWKKHRHTRGKKLSTQFTIHWSQHIGNHMRVPRESLSKRFSNGGGKKWCPVWKMRCFYIMCWYVCLLFQTNFRCFLLSFLNYFIHFCNCNNSEL